MPHFHLSWQLIIVYIHENHSSSQWHYFDNVTSFCIPLLLLFTSNRKYLLLLSKFCSIYPSLDHYFSFRKSHPPAINALCQPSFPISSVFKFCLSEYLWMYRFVWQDFASERTAGVASMKASRIFSCVKYSQCQIGPRQTYCWPKSSPSTMVEHLCDNV